MAVEKPNPDPVAVSDREFCLIVAGMILGVSAIVAAVVAFTLGRHCPDLEERIEEISDQVERIEARVRQAPTPARPPATPGFDEWFADHRQRCEQCRQNPATPICFEAFDRLVEAMRKQNSKK